MGLFADSDPFSQNLVILRHPRAITHSALSQLLADMNVPYILWFSKKRKLEWSKIGEKCRAIRLMFLVLNEADLLFGFDHEQLLREFIQHLPGMMIFSVLHLSLFKIFLSCIKGHNLFISVNWQKKLKLLADKEKLEHFHCCLNVMTGACEKQKLVYILNRDGQARFPRPLKSTSLIQFTFHQWVWMSVSKI